MGRRRHHEYCHQVFLGINPETGAAVTALVIFANIYVIKY